MFTIRGCLGITSVYLRVCVVHVGGCQSLSSLSTCRRLTDKPHCSLRERVVHVSGGQGTPPPPQVPKEVDRGYRDAVDIDG